MTLDEYHALDPLALWAALPSEHKAAIVIPLLTSVFAEVVQDDDGTDASYPDRELAAGICQAAHQEIYDALEAAFPEILCSEARPRRAADVERPSRLRAARLAHCLRAQARHPRRGRDGGAGPVPVGMPIADRDAAPLPTSARAVHSADGTGVEGGGAAVTMGFRSVLAPRLLTRQQAAAYCSVSLPTFESCCPVRAVSLGGSKRLDPYDVRDLDAWIDSLHVAPVEKTTEDWLAALG